MGKDQYFELKESNWKTQSFRFESLSNETFSMPIGSAPPLGESETATVSEHLLLAAIAVQQSILVWLADELALTILREHKRIIFWGTS